METSRTQKGNCSACPYSWCCERVRVWDGTHGGTAQRAPQTTPAACNRSIRHFLSGAPGQSTRMGRKSLYQTGNAMSAIFALETKPGSQAKKFLPMSSGRIPTTFDRLPRAVQVEPGDSGHHESVLVRCMVQSTIERSASTSPPDAPQSAAG
jgi:hypothetical protein